MATFCSQCCDVYGMKADINLFTLALYLRKGKSSSFICEGCHNRAVYKDEMGHLYLAKYINEEINLFPASLADFVNPIESTPDKS